MILHTGKSRRARKWTTLLVIAACQFATFQTTTALPTKMQSLAGLIDTVGLLQPLQHAVGVLSNLNSDSTPDANTVPLVEGQFELSDVLDLLGHSSDANNAEDTNLTVDSSLNPTMAHTTASSIISEPSGPAVASTDTGMIVSTYYPDWVASEFPPEKIDFTRFNWVDFAFAIPDENLGLRFTQPNSEELLARLVSVAHLQSQRVKLSIGGWLGSQYFSRAVRTESARATFARSIVDVYERFGLDGVDLDWEYPNSSGAGQNEFGPQDSANYLVFLKLLRSLLPRSAKITAAVALWPFNDENGRPMEDVSAFGEVLDWIVIMNYDVFGSSSTEPGPNAPLSEGGCGESQSRQGANARSSIKRWIRAGVPSGKVVLGVPSYGVISRSDVERLVHRRRQEEEVVVGVECDFGKSGRQCGGGGDDDRKRGVDKNDKRVDGVGKENGAEEEEEARKLKGGCESENRVVVVERKVAGSGGGGMEVVYWKNGGGEDNAPDSGQTTGQGSDHSDHSGSSGRSSRSGSSPSNQGEGISMEAESRNEHRGQGREDESARSRPGMRSVRDKHDREIGAAGWSGSGGTVIASSPGASSSAAAVIVTGAGAGWKGHGRRRIYSRVPRHVRRGHNGRLFSIEEGDGGRKKRGNSEEEGIRNEEGGMENGQVLFRSLVVQGALVRNVGGGKGGGKGGGGYEAGEGYERRWDSCSSTPWLRGHGQVVSYDDPESMRLKGGLVREMKLGGVGMWSANGDDEGWPLVDGLLEGIKNG